MQKALDMALKGLELMGVRFPENEDEQEKEFLEDIKLLQEKITFKNISNLLNLPDCTDSEQLMIFQL